MDDGPLDGAVEEKADEVVHATAEPPTDSAAVAVTVTQPTLIDEKPAEQAAPPEISAPPAISAASVSDAPPRNGTNDGDSVRSAVYVIKEVIESASIRFGRL
eukprot:SAG31_NODE_1029_length_10253_cov_2.979515_4_plen_102_part_00